MTANNFFLSKFAITDTFLFFYDIVYTDMRVKPNLHLYRHELLNEKNIYIMKTSALYESLY